MQSPLAQPAELTVTDALSRLVLRRALTLPAGSTPLAVPEASRWHGLYVLRLQAASGPSQPQKLVLE